MGRLDYKSGRFTADYETDQIFDALRGWQSEWGDSILYYRFWETVSETHPIWDEATGDGRVYHPAQQLEVMHVTHVEGGLQQREQGSYFNDDIYVVASFHQMERAGVSALDIRTYKYDQDRIVYDDKVFRVTTISVTGQIQRRDTMVSIEGTEVNPDELLNDPQFTKYAGTR